MDSTASHPAEGDGQNSPAPYASQDPHEIGSLIRALEEKTKSKKQGVHVKKTRFQVDGSPDGIVVDSWRFQDWDYKRRDLPTYARGLFTTRDRHGTPEIAVRGYDKFFNVDEVPETRWENIKARTKGPYELSLKENGCIIFISGLVDETLLVCSKHSTGARSDVQLSHAKAGERRLERQLERLGRSKQEFARELRRRNITAVAELCDDDFEEHILAYTPEKAGLYLHGLNVNVPQFTTYPGHLVQRFADEWGFLKTGLIVMDDQQQVQSFLEEVAETGAHDGRDVEGFVIRCKMTHDPSKKPFQDWFFKYKFEEPYLMYRQWRECTKSMIAGKQPRYKKHIHITEEYLHYARQRLAADRSLAKQYNQNHGIIALRNDFLRFKNMKGSEAANIGEDLAALNDNSAATGDLILVPIATLGCGKTTIAAALTHLFGWGHVQNDNITGGKRPPRFTAAIIAELDDRPAVIADRNNAQKHERKQILINAKQQRLTAKLVALNFVHDNMDEVRRITQARVFARGDNHQTIQAATNMNKVRGIMEGFINRFEPCDPEKPPDSGFDAIIDLDATAESRQNLETVIRELHQQFPKIVPEIPSAESMDEALQYALENYKPDLRHSIPDRTNKNYQKPQQRQQQQQQPKKKGLEYMSVDLPARVILSKLEKTFAPASAEDARFFKQLQGTRRIQPRFHVTLMHRASSAARPDLWQRYVSLYEAGGGSTPDGRLGELGVQLERVVFDNRLMAIVVRLVEDGEGGQATAADDDKQQQPVWECTNRVAHVTVGTRDDQVKPKESNDLLARWLDTGSSGDTGIRELIIEGKPVIQGIVTGVASR